MIRVQDGASAPFFSCSNECHVLLNERYTSEALRKGIDGLYACALLSNDDTDRLPFSSAASDLDICLQHHFLLVTQLSITAETYLQVFYFHPPRTRLEVFFPVYNYQGKHMTRSPPFIQKTSRRSPLLACLLAYSIFRGFADLWVAWSLGDPINYLLGFALLFISFSALSSNQSKSHWLLLLITVLFYRGAYNVLFYAPLLIEIINAPKSLLIFGFLMDVAPSVLSVLAIRNWNQLARCPRDDSSSDSESFFQFISETTPMKILLSVLMTVIVGIDLIWLIQSAGTIALIAIMTLVAWRNKISGFLLFFLPLTSAVLNALVFSARTTEAGSWSPLSLSSSIGSFF